MLLNVTNNFLEWYYDHKTTDIFDLVTYNFRFYLHKGNDIDPVSGTYSSITAPTAGTLTVGKQPIYYAHGLTADNKEKIRMASLTWTLSTDITPEDIHGLYFVEVTSGLIYAVGDFDAPITMAENGDIIRIKPVIYIQR